MRQFVEKTRITATILSVALAPLLMPVVARAAVVDGTLVKATQPAVYYVKGGKRFVFPEERTYKTWYSGFGSVTTISAGDLAALQIGGSVTYKPGVKMVKITTDPKVYAVGRGGILHWVTTEQLAAQLYGSDWNKKIDDLPVEVFASYRVGADITDVESFNVALETQYADPAMQPDDAQGEASRDVKRVGDVKQVAAGLELFYEEKGSFPVGTVELGAGTTLSLTDSGWASAPTAFGEGTTYITAVPSAPLPADGSCTAQQNKYAYSSVDGKSYAITYCLGFVVGDKNPGNQTQTSAPGL